MRSSMQICVVIKLHVKKFFTESTSPPPLRWPKFMVTLMLTCDLFAVVNLLVHIRS